MMVMMKQTETDGATAIIPETTVSNQQKFSTLKPNLILCFPFEYQQ
jgi:hypothetical protein